MLSSKIFRAAAALTVVFLVGCQPRIAPPPPTAQVIRVQYTPALAPRLKALHACAAGLAGAGVVVSELPASDMKLDQADLSLRLGQPAAPAGYSAAIGEDEVAAVVNPANHSVLHTGDLAAIFSGQVRTWRDLAVGMGAAPTGVATALPLQIWTYAAGDDQRDAFVATALSGAAIDVRASIAPSPQAMLEAIAADPGAIGYLPRSWVTSQVSVVEIAGVTPARVPLLALAPSEPQGLTRALLACLQGR
jgi:hypothetical protein